MGGGYPFPIEPFYPPNSTVTIRPTNPPPPVQPSNPPSPPTDDAWSTTDSELNEAYDQVFGQLGIGDEQVHDSRDEAIDQQFGQLVIGDEQVLNSGDDELPDSEDVQLPHSEDMDITEPEAEYDLDDAYESDEWRLRKHDPWEDERSTDSDCSFDSIAHL